MPSYRLELIETKSAFLNLEADWKLLLERSEHGFFQSWEYLSLWVKHYGENVKFRVVVLRDVYGVLQGVAPFVLTAGKHGLRRGLTHLTLLGSLTESLAEYLDFIIAPEWEGVFQKAVQGLLQQEAWFEANSLYLELQQPYGNFTKMASDLVVASEGQLEPRGEYVGNYVSLETTWDDYYSKLDTKFRGLVDKAARKLTKDHGMVIKYAGKDISVMEAWAALRALNEHRWDESQGGNVYASAKFCAFHQELAENLAELGWLIMPVMLVGEKVISVRYDFHYQGKTYGFQGGWDPEWGKYKPGQVLFREVLRDTLVTRGGHEFDFMAGGWDYQRYWKTAFRTTTSYEVLNPHSFIGSLFRTARSLKHRFRKSDVSLTSIL